MMSGDTTPVDLRARYIKLVGYLIIAAVIGLVVWGVLNLGGEIFRTSKHLQCQSNFKSLIEAMTLYRSQNNNQSPQYLTQLLPVLQNREDKFICPADPDRGRKGCRPAWLRRDDGNLFAYADLDGLAMDPATDTDRAPCSYLYAANGYPCGLADFQRTWREEFERLVAQYGKGAPLVRCYYHLPELYVPLAEDGANKTAKARRRPALVPDPHATPTYNITADLELKTYQLDWQSDPTFKRID
jgi:hypothetical protein